MAKRFDDDDYGYEPSFQKIGSGKKKSKFKGHQSKHGGGTAETWSRMVEDADDLEIATAPQKPSYTPAPAYKKDPAPRPAPQPTEPKPFQFGEHTREIKGVKIDFDGVEAIEKIDNMKDGVMTYGIKFLFKGKKGLYRITWFNRNQKQRDISYESEVAYWNSLKA